jgi:hypothetical protein
MLKERIKYGIEGNMMQKESFVLGDNFMKEMLEAQNKALKNLMKDMDL